MSTVFAPGLALARVCEHLKGSIPGGADRGDGGGAQGDAVQPALLQQRRVVIWVLSLTYKENPPKKRRLFYDKIPRRQTFARIIGAVQEIGHKLSFQEPFGPLHSINNG